MKASSLGFRAAVLFVIAGMAWGIEMAMSQNHTALPAHAHLNLLGWVSLFLIGVYYRLHPALDGAKAALAQISIWLVGTVVMTAGIRLVHGGVAIGEPLAAVGSLIVLLGMLTFGWLLFRSERATATARSLGAPAE